MKEIIRVEKFLDEIFDIWNRAIYRDETDGRQHYFELYSTFGDYPDLITFESELINGLPEKAISEKAKTILTKCNELVELYNQLLKGVPIKKEVLQIGKLDTKNLTDPEKINQQLYFKDTNNSRLTKLIFDNNDLIRDINHIKKVIEGTTTEPPAGTGTEPTFKDLLITDDVCKQQIIDKIRPLPMSKPKDVFLILAALIEQKIILETERSKIYTAFANEFNYSKSIKSLESSCNNHFAKKSEGDKGYNTQIKNIENHLFD